MLVSSFLGLLLLMALAGFSLFGLGWVGDWVKC